MGAWAFTNRHLFILGEACFESGTDDCFAKIAFVRSAIQIGFTSHNTKKTTTVPPIIIICIDTQLATVHANRLSEIVSRKTFFFGMR